MNKIWKYKDVDLFLCNTACTQKYVENNYELIAETEDEPKEGWFNNFCLNGKLYDVHQTGSYKDTDRKIKNVFANEYTIKPLKDIKEKPQIENINNALCPVCGYVDYYCWENRCPDENYKCPQCKSSLLLEHRFDGDYDGDMIFYQRTTFKKLHQPERIKA